VQITSSIGIIEKAGRRTFAAPDNVRDAGQIESCCPAIA
jgi:hypothetical protein